MRIIHVIAAAIIAMLSAGQATAQNTQLNSGFGPAFDKVTTQWVSDLMSEREFSAVLIEQADTADFLEVTAPSGAVFYIAVRGCDAGAPRQCDLIQPYAFFNASGVTFAQVNDFMENKFVVSYAYLSPGDKGTIASKIILSGGVTSGNVVEEMARFFYDLDNLIDSISVGTIAQIDFKQTHDLSGVDTPKIGNKHSDGTNFFINAVGVNAPDFLTDDFKALVD